jgi:hypothetical protein
VNAWLLLIVMALATYRGTRLVVADTFPPVLWLRDRLVGGWRPLTEKEREQQVADARAWEDEEKPWTSRFSVQMIDDVDNRWVERKKWSPFWLAELLSCPWCASGWVALGVTAGVWAVAGLAMPVLVWLAVWAVGGLLASQEWA